MVSASQNPTRRPKLGVLAGGGTLPQLLIEACRREGRDFFVIAFPDFVDPALAAASGAAAYAALPPEQTGAILKRLRAEGAVEVTLAGSVRRPRSLLALRPDARGAKLLMKMARGWRGDDFVLRAIVHEIEADGFRVVGAETAAPELLMGAGPLGAIAPEPHHAADIALGVRAARELGARDRGQAVIVADGRVLNQETSRGTAAMMENRDPAARGGVLVKVAKPGQERRVDLPSIGADTVRQAAAAGLAGIALEAGGGLVLGRDAVARAADAAGLFVVGVAV